MTITISKIIASPILYHEKPVTVQGVVRTICANPFPHFTLEDSTGTLICESMTDLPKVGSHMQINGTFAVEIPRNCTVQMPYLRERTRCHLLHQRPCGQVGCNYEKEMPRGLEAFAA